MSNPETDLHARIEEGGIIPVIALDDAADAEPLCRALAEGGLRVAEITFRTAAAGEALRIVSREFPEFALGAGTVTRMEDLEAALSAGAEFAVAPGLNSKIVMRAREFGIPFFPGVCTPSEIEAALDCGCRILKYFPAEPMGGLYMIKALYAPYRHLGVRFIPTGGIDASNAGAYLAHPAVLAIGGSWIVAPALIKGKKWDEVTRLTREALSFRKKG